MERQASSRLGVRLLGGTTASGSLPSGSPMETHSSPTRFRESGRGQAAHARLFGSTRTPISPICVCAQLPEDADGHYSDRRGGGRKDYRSRHRVTNRLDLQEAAGRREASALHCPTPAGTETRWVSLADPGEVVEVDKTGKVIRSTQATPDLKLSWVSGVELLPGGGLLIAHYAWQAAWSKSTPMGNLCTSCPPGTGALQQRLLW